MIEDFLTIESRLVGDSSSRKKSLTGGIGVPGGVAVLDTLRVGRGLSRVDLVVGVATLAGGDVLDGVGIPLVVRGVAFGEMAVVVGDFSEEDVAGTWARPDAGVGLSTTDVESPLQLPHAAMKIDAENTISPINMFLRDKVNVIRLVDRLLVCFLGDPRNFLDYNDL